mmetsp:Transcript_16994/g.64742  ORF Transcript_16994/g.64742 Transcript_16994/m.64742 type:complete len:706 (-) Transcript_16994:958-3075(-)
MHRRTSTATGVPAEATGLAHLQNIEGGLFEPFEDGAAFWRAQLQSLLRKAELSALAAPIAAAEDLRVGAQLLEYLLRMVMALELANADEVDQAAAYWRRCIGAPTVAWMEHGPELWMARIEDCGPFPGPLPEDEAAEGERSGEWPGMWIWQWFCHVQNHYRYRLLLFKQSMQQKITALRDILERELESVGALRQHVSLLPQLRDTDSINEWCHISVALLHRVPDVTLPPFLSVDGKKREADLDDRVILDEQSSSDAGDAHKMPLSALLTYPQTVVDAMVGARRRLRARLRSGVSWRRLQPLSRAHRLGMYAAITFPFVASAVWYITRPARRSALHRILVGLGKSMEEFYREHLKEPLVAIINEVVFAHRTPITDVKALIREKDSLKSMLSDYYKEMTSLSDEERSARVQACDMSLITQAYEKSLVTNYNAARSMVTGELVRTLLVQMQFLKVEMMELMRATEILMNENEINMRFMATVPAILMTGAIIWVLKRLFYTTELRKSRPAMLAYLSKLVLAMERFLTLRAGPTLQHVQLYSTYVRRNPAAFEDQQNPTISPKVPSPPNFVDTRTGSFFVESDAQLYSPNVFPFNPAQQASPSSGANLGTPPAQIVSDYSPWRRVLRARDMGKLVLMSVRLSRVLRENRGRFNSDELRSMQEDLDQLVGDRGPMTVGQQLCIIHRMTRSYKALHANNFETSNWLRSLILV